MQRRHRQPDDDAVEGSTPALSASTPTTRGIRGCSAEHPRIPRVDGATWPCLGSATRRRPITVDGTAYEQAWKALSARGWRKREPGPLGAPESPVLLRRALDVSAQAGVGFTERRHSQPPRAH